MFFVLNVVFLNNVQVKFNPKFSTIGKIMAGGSQITINKNGITFITPVKFEVKAGQILFKGGEKVQTEFPYLSEGTACNLKYLFTDDEGIPYKNTPYTAIYPNGSKVRGLTDNEGYSSTFFSGEEKNIQIHLEIE